MVEEVETLKSLYIEEWRIEQVRGRLRICPAPTPSRGES